MYTVLNSPNPLFKVLRICCEAFNTNTWLWKELLLPSASLSGAAHRLHWSAFSNLSDPDSSEKSHQYPNTFFFFTPGTPPFRKRRRSLISWRQKLYLRQLLSWLGTFTADPPQIHSNADARRRWIREELRRAAAVWLTASFSPPNGRVNYKGSFVIHPFPFRANSQPLPRNPAHSVYTSTSTTTAAPFPPRRRELCACCCQSVADLTPAGRRYAHTHTRARCHEHTHTDNYC